MLEIGDEVELSVEEINDALHEQLSVETEYSDSLLGLLASVRDLIGRMTISAHQQKLHQSVMPSKDGVLKSIPSLFPQLSNKDKKAIKNAVNFHYEVDKFNKSYAPLVPAWRDDNPLREIDQLSFMRVVNSYY